MAEESVPRSRVPTGVERTFLDNELIVSKTDSRGVLTYANDVFLKIAGYEESEIIGKPHNIIRHPEMPKSVFKLLWDTIKNGSEIFAYVLNMSKNGDHYWVLAHVTPTFNNNGQVSGFHSNRRVPRKEAVNFIKTIYTKLLDEEKRHSNPKAGAEAATYLLTNFLKEKGMSYDEFIFSF